jgi:GNAT superfamily N-acetyltransferase
MSGVALRWAGVDDARGVAEVHVASWRSAYAGLIDQNVLDGLSVYKRADGWARWISSAHTDPQAGLPGGTSHRLLLAECDGETVGWASFGAGRDDRVRGTGELAGLYVHPEFWSRGIGHVLIGRVDVELRKAGFDDAYLWVLHGNRRAIDFYERHGWRADGEEKIGEAGGATELRELRHARILRPAAMPSQH